MMVIMVTTKITTTKKIKKNDHSKNNLDICDYDTGNLNKDNHNEDNHNNDAFFCQYFSFSFLMITNTYLYIEAFSLGKSGLE